MWRDLPMQHSSPSSSRALRGTLALAALLAAVACTVGTAAAQDDGTRWKPQLPQWAANLFGDLPEPPTDTGPAPAVLDAANPAHSRLQAPREAFSVLPPDAHGKP